MKVFCGRYTSTLILYVVRNCCCFLDSEKFNFEFSMLHRLISPERWTLTNFSNFNVGSLHGTGSEVRLIACSCGANCTLNIGKVKMPWNWIACGCLAGYSVERTVGACIAQDRTFFRSIQAEEIARVAMLVFERFIYTIWYMEDASYWIWGLSVCVSCRGGPFTTVHLLDIIRMRPLRALRPRRQSNMFIKIVYDN